MNLLGGDDGAAGLFGLGGGSGSGRAANSFHHISQDATGSGAFFCLYVCKYWLLRFIYISVFISCTQKNVRMTFTKRMDVVNIVNVLDI